MFLRTVYKDLNEIWSGLELLSGLISNNKFIGVCLGQGIALDFQ